jgi:hypothetical protein
LNPTLNERLKNVGRIFIYLVLIIFLVRNVWDIVDQVMSYGRPTVTQQQVITSTEIPDTAKSVAKLFLQNWYSVGPNQKDEDRINGLKPFVTQNLFDFISSNNDLSIDNSTQGSTSTNTNGQQPEKKGVSVAGVDVWRATWQDQKTGKAKIIARLLTSDSKVLFLSLPVEKSGNTWQVSALPALVPVPRGSGKIAEDPGIDIADKEDAIKTVLDSFFTDWLGGNSEAIKRYMVSGKPIPTSNWLQQLNAQFQGVQTITPVSDNPLKVKVVIMLKDNNGVTMLLDYFMTLEQKNGSWNIVSID